MIHWIPPVTKKSFKKQPHPYASTLHISDNWNTMQEGQQALEEAESDQQEGGPSSASQQLQPGPLTASPTSIDPTSDMGQAASTSADSAAESTTESPTTDKTPTQSTSQPAGGASSTPQPAAMSAPAAAASTSASAAPAPTPPTARPPRPNYPPYTTRPPLPDVNVTQETIEDAYVDFIFHCNPHVPLDTDTVMLRDTFSDPPKSGGKSFNTFVLFGLIKQLENKEIKTWAELALKLGVDPPDPEKGESSQKIQQYAVRLKRWMHSMHIDAFFEYLVGREHEYWVEIPPLAIPLSELERDGVRAEDDMALRALLPHIRPRRGRRKPGEDDAQSPLPPGGGEPWSAHPTAQRGSVFTFDNTRLGVPGQGAPWGNNDGGQTPMTAYPQSAITPTTRTNFWSDEPRSAITPSGSKPKSLSRRHGAKVVSSAWRTGGATGRVRGRPPINRQLNSDGPFSAFPASSDSPHYGKHTFANNPPPSQTPILPPPRPNAPTATQTPTSATAQPSPTVREAPAPAASGRPAKRTRLSLQVPERVGNEVRLATPPLLAPAPAPPTLMINGQAQPTTSTSNSSSTTTTTHPQLHPHYQASSSSSSSSQPAILLPSGPSPSSSSSSSSSSAHPNPSSLPTNHTAPLGPLGPSPFTPSSLADPSIDKYNLLDVESIFMHQIMTATWLDSAGNPIPACSVDEAFAICHTVIENLHRSASNKQGFLINLAALVGGYTLLNRDGGGPAARVDGDAGQGKGRGKGLRITKLGEGGVDDDESGTETGTETGTGEGKWIKVLAVWELRLGGICGDFSMEEVIRVGKWCGGKKKKKDKADESSSSAAAEGGAAGEGESAAESTSAAGGEKNGRGGKRQGKKLSKKEEEELERKKREEELKKAEEEKKMWQQKFMDMVAAVKKRDEELALLKGTMLHVLRERQT